MSVCHHESMLLRRRFFGEQRFYDTATQATEAASQRGERRQAIEQQTQLRTQAAIEQVRIILEMLLAVAKSSWL